MNNIDWIFLTLDFLCVHIFILYLRYKIDKIYNKINKMEDDNLNRYKELKRLIWQQE